MKLIGRDSTLSRDILPRIKRKKPFIVTGQRGIGKSSVLRWAQEQYEGEKVHVSCRTAYGHMLKEIAKAQGLEGTSRMKLAELEKQIMKGPKVALFLDDLDRATPKLIGFLVAVDERWPVYMAGVEPFREELKRLLWGKQKIRLKPIVRESRTKLAELCVEQTGTTVPVSTLANQSRGIPGRTWAIARGEYVREDSERVEGEEINIAPVLLIFVAGIMALRYIGMGIGERDIYMLGGIGMGAAVFLRYFIFSLMRK